MDLCLYMPHTLQGRNSSKTDEIKTNRAQQILIPSIIC
jgi:hypothetical protein